MIKIFITSTPPIAGPLRYIWQLFAANMDFKYQLIRERNKADIVIDETPTSDIPVAVEFYRAIERREFGHTKHFKKECVVYAGDYKDYLATAFYMVNSMQEYYAESTDELGRFRCEDSYQYRYGTIEENMVQGFFDRLVDENVKLSTLIKKRNQASRVFLTHDVESLNGALLQDGLCVMKQGKWHILLSLLFNAMMGRPDWMNMDKIMKLESAYEFKSIFYWLVNRGRISSREVNADYDVSNRKVAKVFREVETEGWENGLHKSISGETIEDEVAKLPIRVRGNRYHYLKFRVPEGYYDIAKANIELDASLGFATHVGFRNSYGLPFHPYDLIRDRPFSFLEMSLHIMDGTYRDYLKVPVNETAKKIISFFERNRRNSILSVLWHNTFFTNYKYKGYLEEYRKLLAYFYESGIECITQGEIISKYQWKTLQ